MHVTGTDNRAVGLLPMACFSWHPGRCLGWLGPFQTQVVRRSRILNLIPEAHLNPVAHFDYGEAKAAILTSV